MTTVWRDVEIFDDLGSAAPILGRNYPDPLICILHSTIAYFRVEFLLVGTPAQKVLKPHVVFHFTLNPALANQPFKECRLSMEYIGDGPTQDGGILTLSAANFMGSHMRATGSFGFVLTHLGKATKIKDWIQVLLGHSNQRQRYSGNIQGNMTQFNFNEVRGATGNQMDGCRDWIAQAFTRFYVMGWVLLCGQELEQTPALYKGEPVTYHNFNVAIPKRFPESDDAPFWFPDIIDKRFSMHPIDQLPNGVLIQPIRMWRGTFLDPAVVRHEWVAVYHNSGTEYFAFPYNYHAPSRPGSSDRSSAVGPSPPAGPDSRPGSSSSVGGGGGRTLASTPSGHQQPNAGASGGNRTGGGSSVGGSSVAQGQSWVKLTVGGEIKGFHDANTRPDKNGWIRLFNSEKRHIGFFNTKTSQIRSST